MPTAAARFASAAVPRCDLRVIAVTVKVDEQPHRGSAFGPELRYADRGGEFRLGGSPPV